MQCSYHPSFTKFVDQNKFKRLFPSTIVTVGAEYLRNINIVCCALIDWLIDSIQNKSSHLKTYTLLIFINELMCGWCVCSLQVVFYSMKSSKYQNRFDGKSKSHCVEIKISQLIPWNHKHMRAHFCCGLRWFCSSKTNN